jgi:ring-1,2-phenylacetyl-CoA epoxidase subunit PaaE
MATFHPLRVSAREQLTDDAVAVTFEVPDELREEFAFAPGQHVSVRTWVDGEEQRRTYSVCAPVGGPLRVGVKRLEGGAVSGWVCDELKVGDVIDVLPPLGSFGPREGLGRLRCGLVAAGSGITPVLSIAASVLAAGGEVVLLFGNRTQRDVMFLEDLADLKDRYPTRFVQVHVLSREDQGSDLLTGRIEGDRLRCLVETFAPRVDGWWVCGPFGLVQQAQELLAPVHVELFHPEAPPERPPSTRTVGTELVAVLGGRTSTTTMSPDETVLEAVLRVRPDAPYACRGGVCGTCRARLTEGEVEMDTNYALEPEELAAGVVLTCQSRPTTDAITVEY